MARIDKALSKTFFARADVDKKRFIAALLKMGAKQLKTPAMRKAWSADNPSKNYCYVVTEWVKCFVLPGCTAYKLFVPGYEEYGEVWHHFNVLPGKPLVLANIVDLTAEQFDDYKLVLDNYTKAVKVPSFMMSPSKRARLLQEYYLETE